MIYIEELKNFKLSVETRLIFALDERAQTFGLHFFVPASTLARDVQSSETTVRRTLNDFKDQGLLKINEEIWLNPDVFSGGNRSYERAYQKQENKR